MVTFVRNLLVGESFVAPAFDAVGAIPVQTQCFRRLNCSSSVSAATRIRMARRDILGREFVLGSKGVTHFRRQDTTPGVQVQRSGTRNVRLRARRGGEANEPMGLSECGKSGTTASGHEATSRRRGQFGKVASVGALRSHGQRLFYRLIFNSPPENCLISGRSIETTSQLRTLGERHEDQT